MASTRAWTRLDRHGPAGELERAVRRDPPLLPAWLRARVWLPALLAFALLAGAWQLVAQHNPAVLPGLGQIVAQLGDQPGLYLHATSITLREAVVGAVAGMGCAFFLAVAMCQLPLLERALMPLAVVLNVTPVVAVAPGLTVAFGFGFTPKYVVTAVIVFFPFLVNALLGLRGADREALEVLSTLHASRFEVLWRLRLPGSLPMLFAGARICVPLSLVGAVVAEFSASGTTTGLGSLITTGSSQADLRQVYASVLVLAVLGVALTAVVLAGQRRLVGWHKSARVDQH